MATLEELVVSLVAETSGLRAELDKAAKATQSATSKMDDAIQSFSENSGKNLSFFESAAASALGFLGSQAVTSAIGVVKDALGAMWIELEKGAEAAIAEEDALKRLANSLALSGQYSQSAMLDLQAFTGRMEDLTGVSDDVVAANLAVLSSLTKLSSDGLIKAQQAALDFSAATGKDLETSTMMVAKAVNGSTESFKKMGINIQESTDKGEALNNTLRALNSFTGSAEASTQTFGGAVLRMSNAWGNFTEELAKAVTQNPVVVAMLQQITDIMKNLTDQATNAGESLQMNLGKALISIADILAITTSFVDAFVRTFKAGLETIVLALNAVAGGIAWVGDALGIVADNDPFERMNETAAALNETVTGDSALSKMADAFGSLRDAGTTAFSSIKAGSEATTTTIKNQKEAVDALTETEKAQLTSFITGLEEKGTALEANYEYENELRAINLETELAQLGERDAAKWELLAIDLETQQMMMDEHHARELANLEAAHKAGLGSDANYLAAKTALANKQFLEQKKLEEQTTKTKQAEEKQREANMASTLGTIATLASSSSKELAAIGKAAAIAQATIDGYAAIQKALASAPPPFNFALAAVVGIATAANISKIAGVGLRDGGTIGGGGANVDTVPAVLAKGETVITRGLTDRLDAFLSEGGNSGGGRFVVELSLRDSLVEFIEAKIIERQTLGISQLTTVGAS